MTIPTVTVELRPFPEGPLVPPTADVAVHPTPIQRADLQALVDRLLHEHFTDDATGAAALRAYKVLAGALESDATLIVITRLEAQP